MTHKLPSIIKEIPDRESQVVLMTYDFVLRCIREKTIPNVLTKQITISPKGREAIKHLEASGLQASDAELLSVLNRMVDEGLINTDLLLTIFN